MSFYELVKDKIVIDEETECWGWTKSTREGYGQIMVNATPWTVHRLSYTMNKGPIPKGKLVRHSCHNTRCCNPDHLSIGTDLDNYRDSIETHRNNIDKRKMNWFIDGWMYDSLRDASQFTGLSQQSIVNHSINGVFDIESYREGCRKGRVKPKI